jgi:hypothetical protein
MKLTRLERCQVPRILSAVSSSIGMQSRQMGSTVPVLPGQMSGFLLEEVWVHLITNHSYRTARYWLAIRAEREAWMGFSGRHIADSARDHQTACALLTDPKSRAMATASLLTAERVLPQSACRTSCLVLKLHSLNIYPSLSCEIGKSMLLVVVLDVQKPRFWQRRSVIAANL